MSYPRGQSVHGGGGQYKKELNILILGQTGVGKTTWINAFYNYARYANIEDAEHGGLKFLIPMQISMTDEQYNDVTVKMGESANEVYRDGESCTKDPFSHEFLFGNRLVRLIDTPGIGDSAGVQQDMKNFKKIVSHLQSVNQIHGILLLLKPNEARLDVTFQFCLKQLLVNLPRDAVKNILFCFTNTRGTNYKPAETLKTLKTLFSTGLESEIPMKLEKQTMYMFDSESVRFLAAKTQGIKFTPLECTTFSTSWKISVTETERLFSYVAKLEPVATGTVATINETREIIQLLQKPIIDISAMIQENIQNVEKIQYEISKGHDLYQQLYEQAIPIKTITFKKLKAPRTVCASPKCTAELEGGGGSISPQQSMPVGGGANKKTKKKEKIMPQRHYKSVCHDDCKIYAFKFLGWTCKCFDVRLNCKKCKCPFSKHISVDFETCIVEQENGELERKLSATMSEVEKKRIISETSQRSMEQLKREQDAILQASAIFANFLRANAILNFNDAVADYMKVLIKVEKESDDSDKNGKLEGLVKMLEAYQRQVEIEKKVQQNASDSGHNSIMSPQDIFDVLEKLYLLPRMGNSIKFLVDEARADSGLNYEPKCNKIQFDDESGVGIANKTGIMRQLWSRSKDQNASMTQTGSNMGWGTLDGSVRREEVTEIKPKKPIRVSVGYPNPPMVSQHATVAFPEFAASDTPVWGQQSGGAWDLKPSQPKPSVQESNPPYPNSNPVPVPAPRNIQPPYPPQVTAPYPTSKVDSNVPYPVAQNSSPIPTPTRNLSPTPTPAPSYSTPSPSTNLSSILGPSESKSTSSLLASILAQPESQSRNDSDDDNVPTYTIPATTHVEPAQDEEVDYSNYDFSKLTI